VKVEEETHVLRERLARAEEELAGRDALESRLKEQLSAVEAESRKFSERFATVEQENSNLANLYVASYRLHSTVERAEVLDVLVEIVTYLIGSEEMAILEVDSGKKALDLVSSSGIDASPFRRIPLGQGVIGRAALSSDPWVAVDDADAERRPEEANVTACIPLSLNGAVTAVVVVFRLLPQKTNGIEAMDRELFSLLATHAAVALYCSSLHAKVTAAEHAA
jgi:nitrate/nitrite-specific signal transduction histidine kinase